MRIFFALAVCSFSFCFPVRAQNCQPPVIVANANTANLFSPEQEMIFGELTIQNMSGDIRLVRDGKLLAYVNEIGARLTKHLPPIGLRFQFHIIDLPEANAFNIPGGHVFLSRKLIAFANNEDELAGVMAHELGHAVVRHGATDMSESLRKVLGVTALGDRKDITEKYNLLIERARTKRISRIDNHENEQQLEADKIGVFAMVAAGYDGAAFSSFFDRLTESKGKTGGWFSDLFGNAPPAQKRLREMIRVTSQMPPACREGRAAAQTENFTKWQADVVSFRETNRKEELPGLIWKRELAPKLRSDVAHFAFSHDGKYLLAQDDFAVTVIERESQRVLFQIPVERAMQATFTLDNRFVVFTTENLRYERWSIAEQKPVEVRELVLRSDCWEHKLSPDGNYLACVDTSTTINILDTKTGKKVWEKKEFYPLTSFEFFAWLASSKGETDGGTNFFRIEFSPDSQFAVFSRSEKFRFRFSVNGITAVESENTTLALDLTTLKTVNTGGDMKKLTSRPYLFLDSERVVGSPSRKIDDAGVFLFPSGKRLQKFTFAAREVKRTANPDYVVIKGATNSSIGVFDVKKGVLASGMNKADATLWNNTMAFESTGGTILLREVNYNEAEKKFDEKDLGKIEMPVGSIRNLDAAEVSDSFNWLLLSSKTRGGLWNLATGERKIYVRGFKGGAIGDDGVGVSEFPKFDAAQHSLVLINPHNDTTVAVRELPEKGARQYGRFVLLQSSLKVKAPGKIEKKDDNQPPAPAGESDDGDVDLGREVRFEIKDFIQDKVVWSREFPKDAPDYSFDEFSGRLILHWRLGSESGKAKLKETPQLQAQANLLGNKLDDYLVEIVDGFAGKPIGMMLLETGKGSFGIGRALSEGNWLVLRDSENRVLVYSIKDGDLRHRFFGNKAAVNGKKNQIAVENFPGEVALYDLTTGERQSNFVVSGEAAFVRFNLAGDKLFVLSDTQSVYAFNLTKPAANRATVKK